MALLTTQNVNRAGVTLSFASATGGGDTMVPDERAFLYVKNGDASGITVTITVPSTKTPWPDLPYGNLVVSVGATSEKCIGPLPAAVFANASTGYVDIGYSAVTSVTVAAIKITSP